MYYKLHRQTHRHVILVVWHVPKRKPHHVCLCINTISMFCVLFRHSIVLVGKAQAFLYWRCCAKSTSYRGGGDGRMNNGFTSAMNGSYVPAIFFLFHSLCVCAMLCENFLKLTGERQSTTNIAQRQPTCAQRNRDERGEKMPDWKTENHKAHDTVRMMQLPKSINAVPGSSLGIGICRPNTIDDDKARETAWCHGNVWEAATSKPKHGTGQYLLPWVQYFALGNSFVRTKERQRHCHCVRKSVSALRCFNGTFITHYSAVTIDNEQQRNYDFPKVFPIYRISLKHPRPRRLYVANVAHSISRASSEFSLSLRT